MLIPFILKLYKINKNAKAVLSTILQSFTLALVICSFLITMQRYEKSGKLPNFFELMNVKWMLINKKGSDVILNIHSLSPKV